MARAARCWSWPRHTGLTVDTSGGLIPNGTYSLVLLFELQNGSGWQRILDLGGGSNGRGLWSVNQHLRFWDAAEGSDSPLVAGTWVQAVLTRDGSTRQVVGYADGVQQFSFTDNSDQALITSGNTLRFFQDVSGDDSAGSVARIRLYDGVLSASQAAALDRAPCRPRRPRARRRPPTRRRTRPPQPRRPRARRR